MEIRLLRTLIPCPIFSLRKKNLQITVLIYWSFITYFITLSISFPPTLSFSASNRREWGIDQERSRFVFPSRQKGQTGRFAVQTRTTSGNGSQSTQKRRGQSSSCLAARSD